MKIQYWSSLIEAASIINDVLILKLIALCLSLSSFYKCIYIACLVFFQARKKEERFVDGLKKIEPKETSETTHDPEILTPEEHFFFLKMGLKCKNYVPVGRRGIYQGVILNMHLHWKKHQTLQVVVKTFSPERSKRLLLSWQDWLEELCLTFIKRTQLLCTGGRTILSRQQRLCHPGSLSPGRRFWSLSIILHMRIGVKFSHFYIILFILGACIQHFPLCSSQIFFYIYTISSK